MRTTKFSFGLPDCGVDVTAFAVPPANALNVSLFKLAAALFTFVAVAFGLVAALLKLFRAIFYDMFFIVVVVGVFQFW